MLYAVAFDGSANSRAALAHAKSVMADGDELALIHVAYVAPDTLLSTIVDPLHDRIALIENYEVRETAKKLEAEMRAAEPSARWIVKEGDPREQLMAAVNECKADVIVVGTRGLSQLASLVLGSVSSYVLQTAKQPVIVVKA